MCTWRKQGPRRRDLCCEYDLIPGTVDVIWPSLCSQPLLFILKLDKTFKRGAKGDEVELHGYTTQGVAFPTQKWGLWTSGSLGSGVSLHSEIL